MIDEFERHLRDAGLSENTVASYLYTYRQFNGQYGAVTRKSLREYLRKTATEQQSLVNSIVDW